MDIMKEWDYWRKRISEGDKSSAPRDWFESVLDNPEERYKSLNYLFRKERMSNPMEKQVGGNHYKNMKIQTATFCMENELDYCQSNIVKYTCRHEAKGGVEDLDKAIHYLELLKEIKYGDHGNDLGRWTR